jgi:hypothetical protein
MKMVENLSQNEANAILCGKDNPFWLSDGNSLKSLQDLHQATDKMSDDVFTNYVNDDKNDFSNWIKDVHGDHELAHSVVNASSASDVHGIVKKRIKQLGNVARNSNKRKTKEVVNMRNVNVAVAKPATVRQRV